MKISEFVEAGLRCPSCGSNKLRGGYHDWHNMDAFICEECGFRWQEDSNDCERILNNIKWRTEEAQMGTRFIWVLSVAEFPHRAILNTGTSDDCTFSQFIKDSEKGDKDEG